jgi:hypothetical protein
VDLSSHNTNPPGAFDGSPCELPDTCGGSDDEAAIAITSFVEEFDVLPTAKLWTAAGMAPTERPVQRYFSSFGQQSMAPASFDRAESRPQSRGGVSPRGVRGTPAARISRWLP